MSACPWCGNTVGHEPLCIGGQTVSAPYGGSPPFERGSETSLAAARSMEESAPTLRDRVEEYVKRCGTSGATDDEIEEALGLRHQTASARRRELELLGRIVKGPAFRLTRSGRRAGVYLAAGGER